MRLHLFVISLRKDEDYRYFIILCRKVEGKKTKIIVRHGPFDILGGGGLGLMSGPENFFRTISEQGYFFAGPSGRIIFFITEIYKYRGFRDNFMLIMVFATTMCLIQAFTTNSGLIQAFATNSNSI